MAGNTGRGEEKWPEKKESVFELERDRVAVQKEGGKIGVLKGARKKTKTRAGKKNRRKGKRPSAGNRGILSFLKRKGKENKR